MNYLIRTTFFLCIVVHYSCSESGKEAGTPEDSNRPYVVVLGIAQDAGFPQADCTKLCCAAAWEHPEKRKRVSCLGIVDPKTNSCWMIDATPDFKDQLRTLRFRENETHELKGILLTHAHVGHYAGLIHLGREVMGSNRVPVYTMPKMSEFLRTNGPWSQLVDLANIDIIGLKVDSSIALNDEIDVLPIRVPHRDEFSETVGYSISANGTYLLFIPDIDKWERWDRNLTEEIIAHDFVLIDGSFYANGEIPNRDMSTIPHPFITETMQVLSELTDLDKSKVHFIHFNHTNPILDPLSTEHQQVIHNGFNICEEGQQFWL